MDRVKELGDALVPFEFDVHVILYADDAPALETMLHRAFNHRRVNRVNGRRSSFAWGSLRSSSLCRRITAPR